MSLLFPRLSHPDVKKYLWRSLPIMLGFSIIMFDDWFLLRFCRAAEFNAEKVVEMFRKYMEFREGPTKT